MTRGEIIAVLSSIQNTQLHCVDEGMKL